MSVVACRVRNGLIKIAADSQFTAGDNRTIETGHKKKIRSIKGMIIAVTGTCDEMDMIYYFAKSNKLPIATEEGVFDYITGFYKKRNDLNDCLRGESNCISNNTYIIVLKGKAFAVSNSFIVELKNGKYRSFGSGWEIATGAMGVGADPEEAVAIACEYNIYCSPPVISYEVPYGKL